MLGDTSSAFLMQADEKPDYHLWYDTSASGDYCYVGDFQCAVILPK